MNLFGYRRVALDQSKGADRFGKFPPFPVEAGGF
jgi:hypothetical protein